MNSISIDAVSKYIKKYEHSMNNKLMMMLHSNDSPMRSEHVVRRYNDNTLHNRASNKQPLMNRLS